VLACGARDAARLAGLVSAACALVFPSSSRTFREKQRRTHARARARHRDARLLAGERCRQQWIMRVSGA